MICLDSPGAQTGEPEYLSGHAVGGTWMPVDRSWSGLRNSVVVSPLLAVHLQ